MLLFSRSRPNFYGFSWVFRGFNRKTKINALLILHVLVIVFLSYTARTGLVFMPFWTLMSILVQDPWNSPAVSRFTMRPFQLGSCSCDAESRGAAALPSKQQLPRQLPSQGSSHSYAAWLVQRSSLQLLQFLTACCRRDVRCTWYITRLAVISCSRHRNSELSKEREFTQAKTAFR